MHFTSHGRYRSNIRGQHKKTGSHGGLWHFNNDTFHQMKMLARLKIAWLKSVITSNGTVSNDVNDDEADQRNSSSTNNNNDEDDDDSRQRYSRQKKSRRINYLWNRYLLNAVPLKVAFNWVYHWKIEAISNTYLHTTVFAGLWMCGFFFLASYDHLHQKLCVHRIEYERQTNIHTNAIYVYMRKGNKPQKIEAHTNRSWEKLNINNEVHGIH